jgi:hypothetical protein
MPTGGNIQISDGMAPVILDARLELSDSDTILRVNFSEEVASVTQGGNNIYNFYDESSGREFSMRFAHTTPQRISPSSFSYRVMEMDKAFPADGDSIRIDSRLLQHVLDTVGNIQNLTVWAPLLVVNSKTLEVYDWLNVFPAPVWLSNESGRMLPKRFEEYRDGDKFATHYGINPAERGVAFVLEAKAALSPNPADHKTRIRIFDQTSNAVTDIIEMKFEACDAGVLRGFAVWDCRNQNGRLVAPKTYVAVIEVELMDEDGQVSQQIYRKAVNISVEGTRR